MAGSSENATTASDEARGRISREVGRGAFLRGGARAGAAATTRDQSAADEVGPADVMAVRRLIEPQVLPRRNDSCERRGACQADRVEMVAALRARELNRAQELMDAHLRRVEANLPGEGKRSQDDRAGGPIASPTG